MSRVHNKKRNVGLLYEFLVQTISRSLVEGDKKSSTQALRVLRKHYKPGTELYKEFRLINSLMKTTVSSETVAGSILQEAKIAARGHDLVELDRQKSLLIKSINHSFGNEDFYDQHVCEYKTYATVQTLLNDWRAKDADIGRIASYEDQLVKWLVTEKTQAPEQVLSEETPGTGRLLMKVMMKRLNEKYSGMLTGEQRQLIRAYAFSAANDDPESMKKKLIEVKTRLVSLIDGFDGTEYVNKKLEQAREQLVAETFDTVDDSTVTRFMLYAKLGSELCSEEGGKDV